MAERSERDLLVALFAAIEDPRRAGELGDDPRLLAVARRHRLTPLLSMCCRNDLPPALRETCRRDHVMTAAQNLALSAVAEECVGALVTDGVEAAILKGLAYERALYPSAGARPTSDIDVLVRDRDRRTAFATLDRLGFEPRAAAPGFDEPDYHEVAWTRAGVEIDLHLALAPFARCAIDYDDVWRSTRAITVGSAEVRVLAPAHAAVFHALHMAIDHFDVPGLYLADLARLLPDPEALAEARDVAHAWRCRRPLETALSIAAAFQPTWADRLALRVPPPAAISTGARIAASFGQLARLPRARQLWRKYEHFDSAWDALRYTWVQGRRNARERAITRLRPRSARERLGLAHTRRP